MTIQRASKLLVALAVVIADAQSPSGAPKLSLNRVDIRQSVRGDVVVVLAAMTGYCVVRHDAFRVEDVP